MKMRKKQIAHDLYANKKRKSREKIESAAMIEDFLKRLFIGSILLEMKIK